MSTVSGTHHPDGDDHGHMSGPDYRDGSRHPQATAPRSLTVALAGQPNVGKSSVFNALTGASEHVGNWPGKTVARKTGTCRWNGTEFQVVDLPGTYSLTANSVEEQVARDFIILERPDVVVVVVSAAALERGLYLLSEILLLGPPVVLGLNMVDVAAQEGLRIEPHVLEAALGIPVVPMVAAKGEGVSELLRAVACVAERAAVGCGSCPAASIAPCAANVVTEANRPTIRADHREVLEEIEHLIASRVPDPYPIGWVALKLLEGDPEITDLVRGRLDEAVWGRVHAILMAHEDAILAVAGGRYEWIARMVRAAVVRPRIGQVTLTDRLDRYATHPVWGLFVLLAALGSAFWLTYAVGSPIQELLATRVVDSAARAASSALAGAPTWLVGLVATGIIGGAGTVLTFVPILAIFFAVLALLEDVGYMARAAYVMDRFMHLMGLHGKSFLPMCLGFGCNVPAITGARIVDSPRARILTMLLAPFVPCTARLGVLAVLAPAFFGRQAALVAVSLVALNLLVLGAVGVLAHRTVLGGERVAFIMELPLYHVPNPRVVGRDVRHRTWEFIRKAGTVIVAVSVIVWALSFVPSGDIESSYLAGAARVLEPFGTLMGMSWRMIVALLGSFVAKENTVAILGVLYGAAGADAGLARTLSAAITPAAALAFLAVQLLFVPCAATVAAMRQEAGSWRLPAASVGITLVLSLGVGIAIYQVAARLGWGV